MEANKKMSKQPQNHKKEKMNLNEETNEPDFLVDPVSFDIKMLSPAVANILLHTDLFGSYGQTDITTSPKEFK